MLSLANSYYSFTLSLYGSEREESSSSYLSYNLITVLYFSYLFNSYKQLSELGTYSEVLISFFAFVRVLFKLLLQFVKKLHLFQCKRRLLAEEGEISSLNLVKHVVLHVSTMLQNHSLSAES